MEEIPQTQKKMKSTSKKNQKMEDDLKKINLIGCDTIVNQPSQTNVGDISNKAISANQKNRIYKTKTSEPSETPHTLSVTQLLKEVISKPLAGKSTITNGDIKVTAFEEEPIHVLKRPGEFTNMAANDNLQGKVNRTLLLLIHFTLKTVIEEQ